MKLSLEGVEEPDGIAIQENSPFWSSKMETSIVSTAGYTDWTERIGASSEEDCLFIW